MDISGVEAEAEVRTNHMVPAGVMKNKKKEEVAEEEEVEEEVEEEEEVYSREIITVTEEARAPSNKAATESMEGKVVHLLFLWFYHTLDDIMFMRPL